MAVNIMFCVFLGAAAICVVALGFAISVMAYKDLKDK